MFLGTVSVNRGALRRWEECGNSVRWIRSRRTDRSFTLSSSTLNINVGGKVYISINDRDPYRQSGRGWISSRSRGVEGPKSATSSVGMD